MPGKRCCKSVPVALWSNSQRRGYMLAGNGAGTARAFQHVIRPDPVPVRRGNARHATDVPAEAQACC